MTSWFLPRWRAIIFSCCVTHLKLSSAQMSSLWLKQEKSCNKSSVRLVLISRVCKSCHLQTMGNKFNLLYKVIPNYGMSDIVQTSESPWSGIKTTQAQFFMHDKLCKDYKCFTSFKCVSCVSCCFGPQMLQTGPLLPLCQQEMGLLLLPQKKKARFFIDAQNGVKSPGLWVWWRWGFSYSTLNKEECVAFCMWPPTQLPINTTSHF